MARRLRLPVAVALSLIIAAGAIEYLSARSSQLSGSRISPQWTSIPAANRPSGLPEEMTGSRLYGEAPVPAASESDGPMTLDDFVGLLAQRVPKPVAQRVVQEFKKDKQLNAAWKMYKKTRGGKAPAKEFVDFITRIPQFRQLMARFRADAGFKQAFADVAKQKEASAVIRGALKGVSGGVNTAGAGAAFRAGGGLKAQDVDAIRREWERKARSGVDLGGYQMAGSGPMAGAREMTTAGMISHPSAAGGNPATGGGPGQSAVGGSLGGGQRNTKELDKSWQSNAVDDKGKEQFDADRRFMTKLMKSLTDEERRKIEAAMCLNPANVPCNPTVDHDIWGACWSSGLLERCKALCAEVAECAAESGEKLWNSFAACEAGGARQPQECIIACKDKAHGYACTGAEIDQSQWTLACLQKTVPDPSYCSDQLRWGECSDPAGVNCAYGSWDVEGDGVGGAATAAAEQLQEEKRLEALCVEPALYTDPQCTGLLAAAMQTNKCILSVYADLPECQQQGGGTKKNCVPPKQGPCPDGSVVDSCTGACPKKGGPVNPGGSGSGGPVCSVTDGPQERGIIDSVIFGATNGYSLGSNLVGNVPVVSQITGTVVGLGGVIVEGGGAVLRAGGKLWKSIFG